MQKITYISHGGGPLPLLGDQGHAEMVTELEKLGASLGRPSAILVISAHWEAAVPTVTSGAEPELIYDYYGFPEESYSIQYPAPGEPVLAEKVYNAVKGAGIEALQDEERGFDHGLFIPLKIMYPEADIPCVQLSLIKGLDPEAHIRLGEAIKELEYENLLIIGSGFSFHNMREFFTKPTRDSIAQNEAFERWLIETCASKELSDADRRARLVGWADAPSARFCHPREEHLLPLHVCAGAAGRACSGYVELNIINKKASLYIW